MATLIITEKASQARDLRAALGARFGQILPAEGHLLRLAEPEEVNPAWKNWSCAVLKPDGLYPTRPAAQGNKPAKLKVIAAALRTCDEVILATDCDREGQLIGQEILDHLGYRGRVRRALFTAQDPKTLQQAFARLKPNVELRPLYEGAYGISVVTARRSTLSAGHSGCKIYVLLGSAVVPRSLRPRRHAGRAQALWRRAVLPNPTPIIFIEVLTKCQYRLKLKFAISE
jgi:hypothetical protein